MDKFENLSDKDKKRIGKMVLQTPVRAIMELRNITGCSIFEGKIWVENKRQEKYIESLPPCPYCGEKLRTPLAKQCRFCLRDWHDENELKWLK